jgi:hypothetical protein
MNRRNFFGNIGAILAVAAAPSIFIPKTEPVNWGKPLIYVPREIKLKARWTLECEQDLMAYHSIDAEQALREILTNYAQSEVDKLYPGRKVISIEKRNLVVNPATFSPYYGTIAVIA